MLKKLHFDQTKKYERSVAANEIAKMLVAFIQEREHSLSIGAEQGGIDKWDDFVIETSDRTYKHIQAKRQQKDFFPKGQCIRQPNSNGNEIPLSPLDETMRSLAYWVNQNDPNTASPKRRFIIELPDNTTHIKNEIQVSGFHTLRHTHICPVTTVRGLENLANNNPCAKNCFDWLTTWCDFSGWEHILKALRLLEIKLSGNENDIDRETETTLGYVFCKPSEVRRKIISYIDDNITFTGAITPRPLLKELKDYLLPSITTWTQYQKRGSIWRIAGTHGLESDEVERASYVVPSLWRNDRARHLKFDAPAGDSTKLSRNVLQLALHLQGQVNAHFTDLIGWKQAIKSFIGGTLGVSRDDCINLSLTENLVPLSASDFKELHKRDDFEDRAVDLKKEMIKVTWELVVGQLEQRLDELQQTELRTTIEARWQIWKTELDQNSSEQETLFLRILHAEAEGNDISADLRVGPKTASLIADAIYLLLVVSTGLSDSNTDWKTVGEDLSVNTIGLKCWSDPSTSPRKVRDLDDEGVEMLISKESTDVLILPQTHAPISEIFEDSIVSDGRSENNLASPSRPQLLVTNTIPFKRLVTKGDINLVGRYLNEMLEKKSKSIKKSIEDAL